MIALLSGKLADKQTSQVIVDAQGVGYLVTVSLNTLTHLPRVGEPVTLKIHTNVREGDISLFGFHTLEEKELFQALIGINKIGPKLAVAILSGLNCSELKAAISQNNIKKISSIPGIGKKTAERLVLELQERFSLETDFSTETGGGHLAGDKAASAVSALINLGYQRAAAEKAVKRSLEISPPPDTLESLIKHSLKSLLK
ncbi:MAG: Holliday junction branch migration protein RuvA [bacterium]